MRAEVSGAGGFAQDHYPDIRLCLEKGMVLKDGDYVLGKWQEDAVIGNRARIWAEKNRSERPMIKVDFPVLFGKGISNTRFLLEFAKNTGVITGGAGGYFTIFHGDNEIKVRGEGELENAVKDNLFEIRKHIEDLGLWKLVGSGNGKVEK